MIRRLPVAWLRLIPGTPASEPGINLFIADEAGIAPVRPGYRVPNRFCLPLVERDVRFDGFGRKPSFGAVRGVSKFIEPRERVGIEPERHCLKRVRQFVFSCA